MRLHTCLTTALLLATLVLPRGVQAQQDSVPRARPDTAQLMREARARLGADADLEQVIEMIRRSGMSPAQMRVRLEQAGYDPDLVDEYLDLLQRRATGRPADPSKEFLTALSSIGLTRSGLPPTKGGQPPALRDSEREQGRDTVPDDKERGIEVFGLALFGGSESEFEPLVGPVDPGYIVGPGDELVVVSTGDVELAYTLEVTREGLVFIPDVGQVQASGLTLEALQTRLYQRMGQVYSGMSPGAGARSRLHVSIGRLRVNQIFVIGDVARPGSYQVSSIARVLNALFRAGGPTEYGSFRHIEIRRGERLLHTLDLYEYLLRGDSRGDVQLQNGDRIFVPPVLNQVTVEGAVRRPAIYEVKDGEGLADVLQFAGGLRSNAITRRIQIDRIVPPSERQPGAPRVLVDVDLAALLRGEAVPVLDGDIVRVFTVSDERRNRIVLEGAVRNPGIYEWHPGLTLSDVVRTADGLAEHAYLPRAHIYRLDAASRLRNLVAVDLGAGAGAAVLLADRDSIVILDRAELTPRPVVSVHGLVQNAGEYELAEGMTLQDLILSAGGLEPGAFVVEAEIVRLADPLVRSDTTSFVLRVPLASPAQAAAAARTGIAPDWQADAAGVTLQPGDRAFIRRAPGYDPGREVSISGEVMLPGAYGLARREERITDLLARAGGLTAQANLEGMHVVRDSAVVAADLARALRDPADRNNIVLQPGDSVHVPAFDPTVVVTGAVAFEARVLFREGRDLNWYIDQAGGFLDTADEKRVTVSYRNGQRAVARKHLLFTNMPDVRPGSVIHVPMRPENSTGTNWDMIFTRTLTALGTLATVLLAVNQLR